MAILPPGILARVFQIRLCNGLRQRGLSSSSSSIRFLVEECGIPLSLSSPLSQKIHFEEKKSSNVKSVIAFFRSHEFSEAEIAKLILKYPPIIYRRVASNLSPKLHYLIESGFKGSLLRRMVLAYPRVFHHGLSSNVKRAPEILKSVLLSDENVCTAISRAPRLLWSRNLASRMKLNVEYLTRQGMPNDRIVMLVLSEPKILIHINKKLVKLVEKIKELGVMPHDTMFLHGVQVMIRISESTWKRKVGIFKRLGWSDKDVASTFARQPNCFTTSEEKLKTAMEYFVNEMGIPRQVIIAEPVVLMYSLKERIRPRCGVVKILQAEGLSPNCGLSTILVETEKVFIRRYIMKHRDAAPGLLETYHRIKKSDVREEVPEMNALSQQHDDHVVRAMTSTSESTWKRKVDLLKRLGWPDKDVASTFARQPCCYTVSEEKLKTAMDYFVNQMGIPRQVTIAAPVVLMYSMKERIRPRCGVVKILEAEGLLPEWHLPTILSVNEKVFIERYIMKHRDAAPHLLETYHRIKR